MLCEAPAKEQNVACLMLTHIYSQTIIRAICLMSVSLTVITHCGPVTKICVFTLQLCKTDDANLRF